MRFWCKYTISVIFIIFQYSGAKGTLATQTFIHHILGASGFYLTLYTEDVPVVFGVMSLLLEASTVFLDLRWFIYEFKITNTLIPLLNTGSLFIAYLFSRVFYQTYISFFIAYPHFYRGWVLQSTEEISAKGKNPTVFRAIGVFMLVTNLLSQAINYHWFSLIIKQLIRNAKKALGQKVTEEADLQTASFTGSQEKKKDK